jgi:hypothetical protein
MGKSRIINFSIDVLLILMLGWSQSGQASAEPSAISAQLRQEARGKRVLVTRGSSIAKLQGETFTASTKVSRIPCPGKFRFEVETEDLRTGGLTAYSVDISLSQFRSWPPGIACGVSIPALPGMGSVVLMGGSGASPLWLKGQRAGFGNFIGRLRVAGFPACGISYELRATFDLRQWDRAFYYEAQFDDAQLSYPGNVAPPLNCR